MGKNMDRTLKIAEGGKSKGEDGLLAALPTWISWTDSWLDGERKGKTSHSDASDGKSLLCICLPHY